MTLALGRYELLGEPLIGGEGEVYRARALGSDTVVAARRLMRSRPHQLQLRELRALQECQDPAVVRLIDHGEDEWGFWIIMEWVEGTHFPLNLPPERAERLVIQLLQALARLHARGFCHRDLKPSNVMVRDQQVVLLDFGLARHAAPGDTLSRGAELAGTLLYLPPECFETERVGLSADLYAVGVLIHQALTGRTPWDEMGQGALIQTRLFQEVPALRCPERPALAELARRLLRRDPSQRPHSAAEALALLQEPAPEPDRPWLGSRLALEALVDGGLSGRGARVYGPRGSGRTRTLNEALSTLRALGKQAVLLPDAAEPLGSLAALLGDPPGDEVDPTRWFRQALSATLGATVIGIDESASPDPLSLDLLRSMPAPQPLLWAGYQRDRQAMPLPALGLNELMSLFTGHDRVLHQREDAAGVLLQRTHGRPRRVFAELDAWVEQGLARVEPGGVRVARSTLDAWRDGAAGPLRVVAPSSLPTRLNERCTELLALVALAGPSARVPLLRDALKLDAWRLRLALQELEELGLLEQEGELLLDLSGGAALLTRSPKQQHEAQALLAQRMPPGEPGRLIVLLLLGEPEPIAQEVLTLSQRLSASSHIFAALALLTRAWRDLRAAPRARALLREPLTLQALATEDPRTLTEAAALLAEDPEAGREHALLLALQRAKTGDPAEARALADALPPWPHEDLDCWRQSARLEAARRQPEGAEQALLEELLAWASAWRSEVVDARMLRWLGHFRYQRGDFAAAMRTLDAAAQSSPEADARIGILGQAASAALECGDLEGARQRAERAVLLAAECRHTLYEARSAWHLRRALYRAGEAKAVDEELLGIFEQLGNESLLMLLRLNEAAVAARLGQLDRARELALGAVSFATPWSGCTALALALSAQLGAPLSAAQQMRLCAWADQTPHPGLTAQISALIAPWLSAAARERYHLAAQRWLLGLPEHMRAQPREILAPQEALELLYSGALFFVTTA